MVRSRVRYRPLRSPVFLSLSLSPSFFLSVVFSLAMEIASCTRASVGSSLSTPYRGSLLKALSTPCRGSLPKPQPLSPSARSLQASAKQNTFNPLCSCIVQRNVPNSDRRLCVDPPPLQGPTTSAWKGTFSCFAVDGNSTSSSGSTTADANPPSPDEEQEGDLVAEYEEESDKVGKALSQMRQERLLSGEESASKSQEFWRGVLEEIQLIEWPSLQKVLGTTGVVTGIIIGSSLVLLTVNALLAQLSDAVFKNTPPA